MEQQEGTMQPGSKGKVMRLLKCLFGLNQTPQRRNMYVDTVLKQMGFVRLKYDFGTYEEGGGEDTCASPCMSMMCFWDELCVESDHSEVVMNGARL